MRSGMLRSDRIKRSRNVSYAAVGVARELVAESLSSSASPCSGSRSWVSAVCFAWHGETVSMPRNARWWAAKKSTRNTDGSQRAQTGRAGACAAAKTPRPCFQLPGWLRVDSPVVQRFSNERRPFHLNHLPSPTHHVLACVLVPCPAGGGLPGRLPL